MLLLWVLYWRVSHQNYLDTWLSNRTEQSFKLRTHEVFQECLKFWISDSGFGNREFLYHPEQCLNLDNYALNKNKKIVVIDMFLSQHPVVHRKNGTTWQSLVRCKKRGRHMSAYIEMQAHTWPPWAVVGGQHRAKDMHILRGIDWKELTCRHSEEFSLCADLCWHVGGKLCDQKGVWMSEARNGWPDDGCMWNGTRSAHSGCGSDGRAVTGLLVSGRFLAWSL